MLDNLLAVIREEHLAEQLYHSLVGLEVEEQRIDQQGRLSRRPHPSKFGSRTFHPYFQTDFTESQLEVITDPNPNIGGTLDQLDTLQTVAYRTLEGDDRIWPLSMPPVMDETDLQFVADHFERPAVKPYREYLVKKYGLQHGCMTGVHVNYSLPDPVIHRLFSHYTDEFETIVAFKNALYFRIAQNFVRYQWLLTYLFGASPIAEAGFFETPPAELAGPVRSIRNSRFGFVNRPEEQVTYASLDRHLQQLQAKIDEGTYFSAHEFYGPVRLKGQANAQDFLTGGIQYLELRDFDNTPWTPNGVSRHALYFLKMFMIYLMTQPLPAGKALELLATGRQRNQLVALEDPRSATQFQASGQRVFREMRAMADQLQAHNEQWGAIDDLEEVLMHPELTPAAKLVTYIKDGSLMAFGQRVARQWYHDRITAARLLPQSPRLGTETQRLIMTALQLGIRFYQVRDEDGEDMFMFTFDGITQVLQERDTMGKAPEELLRRLFPDLQALPVEGPQKNNL
ncbi:gamma-glutamylcysteine synthetase [Levilactobacillus tujiorum]|uniref:gamma-glutamylcysteine synthetase n=1 Tax=Levilactobacillus tujiorum TaxID=2912243 RepID=UPI001456AA5B|nr:gamma-glutamylcysteine synthetase [Levilactobacillus tujiorum]NLR33042.1 gamma-glutamylcysteine synthetase [Levilactobacillus tujiorum]